MEEPGECRIVPVHGKRQCSIPHSKILLTTSEEPSLRLYLREASHVYALCAVAFTKSYFIHIMIFQVMFPSTLLGTGENWTLLKTISVTEYLNYESGTNTCFTVLPLF